jgi:uncharacterized protein YgbK (DUF1537 family)
MAFAAAIVGDDLTGTLDAVAPFAARGMSSVVAITPEDTTAALATGAAVIAVNTVSRAAPPEEAAARVGHAARMLAIAEPAIAFKKLDSRLKGNLAAETAAALWGFERPFGLVCPAIPDLGRIVAGGCLRGFGVDAPIEIAPRLGGAADRLTIPDATDERSLHRIAGNIIAHAGATLALGARGLAEALADVLVRHPRKPLVPFPLPRPIVLAIGSRDPITGAQIEAFLPTIGAGADHRAPDGALAAGAGLAADIGLYRITEGDGEADMEAVANRFAAGLAEALAGGRIGTLFLCGGDTAFAVLRALGVRFLRVEGEAVPGVPWSTAAIDGRPAIVLTKSGGLGYRNLLADLVAASGPIEGQRYAEAD